MAQTDSVKFKILPDVVVIGYGVRKSVDIIQDRTTIAEWTEISGVSLKGLDVDSVGWLGSSKKELAVYPNPVRKGGMVNLSWPAGMGRYQVGLFNATGALIQQRWMEVGSSTRIDLFEIPAALAAGTYFFRAVREGSNKVITRKIVVI